MRRRNLRAASLPTLRPLLWCPGTCSATLGRVRWNRRLQRTQLAGCALPTSATWSLESSPWFSALGRGEKKKSWFPGQTLARADAPRGRSGAQGAAAAALSFLRVRGRRCPPSGPAQRPLPGRALLTRPRLVGATSRRASAPPLVTRPARTPTAHLSRLPPARPRVTCPPRPRNSSGGKAPCPNIRGGKKSLPLLSASSNRLNKNISSSTEKTVYPTLNDDQPCDCFKKGNRVNESYQKTSNMNAGPSRTKVQHPKNSRKRQSKPQVPHISSQLKSSLRGGVPQPTEDKLKESISPEGNPERSPLGPRYHGLSGNKLFLDFESMKIIKEDVEEEDSASDLSDSERIAIPPSPLTPPDLHLRAEEIDPVHFDLHLGQGPTWPEYCYPDFLPPPCNSWDLRDMAMLLHSERRTEAVPKTGGLLGKYIDRLVQLEWLQIQTIQCEKGKVAKGRPPTAPGTSGALKSPGRSKLMPSALSRPHQEGPLKSGPSRKKDMLCKEVHPFCYSGEASPRPLDVLSSSRLCSQKQTLEVQTEKKKKKSNKSPRLQPWDLSCRDGGPKIESNGNLRAPRPPAMILDPADGCRAARAPAHTGLKKKGNVSNCAHATISSEKKLKTNGGKQNTYKFKK